MPAYSGKYQYLDEAGATLHQGPCQLKFEEGTCVVTPAGATPLAKNGYKVPLTREIVQRTVLGLATRA